MTANLAEEIKWLREKNSMTQVELCKRAGISEHCLSDIERGMSVPNYNTLDRIAKVFQMRVSALIREAEDFGK